MSGRVDVTLLHHLSGVALHRRIRAGEVSSCEVVEWFLDRVDRFGNSLGAFITVTAEDARAQAHQVDAARPGQGLPSPLAGVPTAVKDLLPVRGTRTTYGSAVFADHVAGADAQVVSLLREAGMPLLGKTSTAEFGFASYTEPDVAQPARCPWDPRMSAGGSSGGAAAAVAAGLVPVAHGSDSAGSIRIPASACGVVGVKPTRGRISNGPNGTERFGLATQGVLSRTVADGAALLDQLCTPQPGDPYPPVTLPAGGFSGALTRRPEQLQVEVWTTSPLTRHPPHERCQEAVSRTATVLEEQGHKITWGEPPDLSGLIETFMALWTASAASVDIPDGAEHRLQPLTRALRERGSATTGVEVCRAVDAMHAAIRWLTARMGPWDVLLTPTLAAPPCSVGSLRDDDNPMQSFLRQAAYAPYTAMWNCAGNPAMSLPVHWTAEGLPVGVQIVGRMADEARLFSLAGQLEEAFGWPHRYPDEAPWTQPGIRQGEG
jgi:amidase